MSNQSFGVAVIGAGIAGAGAAAELAPHASVLLIEREDLPGYHTTGRSAAVFAETYGPAPIRSLTRASAGFFKLPPAGFSETPLVSPRGILLIARADQADAIQEMERELADGSGVERLDAKAVEAMMPLVRSGYAAAGLFDAKGQDIDVFYPRSGSQH